MRAASDVHAAVSGEAHLPCLQLCLLLSGIAFGAGIVLLAAAQDLAMVNIGRILMGAGVGFANSSSTLCTLFPLLKLPAESYWPVAECHAAHASCWAGAGGPQSASLPCCFCLPRC